MIHHYGTDSEGLILVSDVEAIRCQFDKPFPLMPGIDLAPGDTETYEIRNQYDLCGIDKTGFYVMFRNPALIYKLRYFVSTAEEKEVKQPNHYRKKNKKNE